MITVQIIIIGAHLDFYFICFIIDAQTQLIDMNRAFLLIMPVAPCVLWTPSQGGLRIQQGL